MGWSAEPSPFVGAPGIGYGRSLLMVHIPLLRRGRPYKSLNTITVKDFRSGDPIASVSQANTGLIAKDLSMAAENKRMLEKLSISELLIICKRAAHLFSGSAL